MTLSRYQEKRDFSKTPEPRGRVTRRQGKALAYLIQKHAASHLHYDFRLELDGVLLSWAVPKGPSLDPADKRLAMHVEDHPIQYGDFEGIIPRGQYGGGTVMLWDRGTWNPIGDPQEGYRKGHLKFELNGRKLGGQWALIKMHGNRYGGKGEPWLLVKDNDDYARRGAAAHIVDSEPDSVVSGRGIEEISAASDRQWQSNRSVAANVKAGAIKKIRPRRVKSVAPTGVSGARRAPLPALINPTLATLVEAAPTGADWIHEVKYDGYRILARLHRGNKGVDVRMYSRNGKDWTERFASIADELRRVEAKTAWLDGEICALDERGHSVFQRLQNALSTAATGRLLYFAFDLLYLDGYDLSGVVLSQRKRLLELLLEKSGCGEIQFSPAVRGEGGDVFKQVCRQGLEGIVSKRADSTYAVGRRTRDWLKIKCSRRQEMIIGGFTDPQGRRPGLGALLLGYYEGETFRYSGKVGAGFNERTLTDLRRRLNRIERKTPPFANPPRGFEARGAHWVTPVLVAEIGYTEWSEAGALRHPVFIGLREDKNAADVVREESIPVAAADPAPPPGKRRTGAARVRERSAPPDKVAGIVISHPDKPFFPEAGHTKLALARYYEAVGEWILPYIERRPLSLLRCPDGWQGECFYQKHADRGVHPAVSRVEVPEGGGTAVYFSADSLPALIALVQWGVIELHPWGSHMPHPERPDQLIIDFDPGSGVPWARLVEAARMLRSLLEGLELTGFLKTTGGKGLHVVIPIEPTLTWTEAKIFAKSIADLFAAAFPDRFTATPAKSRRAGRIFIDYLRNSAGATAVAPYGVRARKNAPVAMPIDWKELRRDVRYDYFNLGTVPQRLKRRREDPWHPFAATRQTITREIADRLLALRAGGRASLARSKRRRR
jgi:bifunctional non-homologous end joining protein LigD